MIFTKHRIYLVIIYLILRKFFSLILIRKTYGESCIVVLYVEGYLIIYLYF